MTLSEYFKNNYVAEATRQATIAGQKPGLYIQTILHDDWCRLLNGKGACNCNPEVRTVPFKG